MNIKIIVDKDLNEVVNAAKIIGACCVGGVAYIGADTLLKMAVPGYNRRSIIVKLGGTLIKLVAAEKAGTAYNTYTDALKEKLAAKMANA